MNKCYYYASPLFLLVGYWTASCGVSLYYGHITLFIVEFIIFLVIMVKKDAIFYPYVSALCISDTAIERQIFGVVHTTLSREGINVRYLMINGTKFVVFSQDEMEHYWAGSVAALARKHRAIMYPVMEKMLTDFPTLFNDKR